MPSAVRKLLMRKGCKVGPKPRLQQNAERSADGIGAHGFSPFAFTELRVAKGLLSLVQRHEA
jgi:hypothetical protein